MHASNHVLGASASAHGYTNASAWSLERMLAASVIAFCSSMRSVFTVACSFFLLARPGRALRVDIGQRRNRGTRPDHSASGRDTQRHRKPPVSKAATMHALQSGMQSRMA